MSKRRPVYDFEDYKLYLKHRLRESGERGQLSRAADALGCQRSYLSRIMNTGVQMTPDQAFAISEYWELNSLERDYFLTLVEHGRAGKTEYRDHLNKKLIVLRQNYESLSERMRRPEPEIAGSHELTYFSAWHWSAIHFLSSIPEFQSVETIGERLSLNRELVRHCLENLKIWGLIRSKDKRWIYKTGEFHLPKDSPLVALHHGHWRNRAVADVHARSAGAIHYTNVQTLARSDLPALRALALDFIDRCNQLTRPSAPEEAMAINLDLFRI